ncbi:hypothetical protein [Nitrolancea hollandica]|uniref:Uncharacterized protein n=1 Tax=Nitrolancea hollandica Lb TaxID=1129897 RepID=I4EDX2_9BACT|nr:hypothetical protein [Nitrolancea hollandica]CCF82884.1 membrane hypothetical protein [Nitrolancea hollandica Lb]
MNRPGWLWPLVIAISALASGLISFWDVESPLRPAITLWFLIVCPGMALVRLLRLRDGVTEWAIAIALSLALETGVNEIMLYTGRWAPEWSLLAVMTITLLAVIPQLPVLHRASTEIGEPR